MATIEGPETSSFAIVGYAARFPGATDAESFWEMLREGRDAVSEVPQDRWDVDEFFDADPDARGKIITCLLYTSPAAPASSMTPSASTPRSSGCPRARPR